MISLHLLFICLNHLNLAAYLVLRRGHSYLVLDIFISNLISPSMSTHPFQHPYFSNFHLLNVSSWLVNTSLSLSSHRHHSENLPLNFGGTFLCHKILDVSPHFIHPTPLLCVTSLSISPSPWVTDPRYVKLTSFWMALVSSLAYTLASCVTSLGYPTLSDQNLVVILFLLPCGIN